MKPRRPPRTKSLPAVELAGDSGDARLFLSQRAYDFVEAAGRTVHEDALIAHIFGTSRSPDLWRPLFYAVMRQTPELRERGDRQWAIARTPARLDVEFPEFVAIDVETTGLRPSAHRIIEIGLVRFSEGKPGERLAVLLDPQRRLPAYISKLTGIRDADLRGRDRFEMHAESIEGFIGDAVLVGHNVSFDIGFVDAELRRAGRAPLINDRLDTMALALRYLPDLRRASLDKVASALGLPPRTIHRAESDAELAGRAAVELIRIAAEQGDRSIDVLKANSRLAGARPRDGIGRGRSMLDPDVLKTIPHRPGVYLMLDANRRVIYVGKAKDLHDRVASYYSQPLGYTRKMDGLLESIASIEIREVGCELDALLLESQLIKRYQPRYNKVMRSHEQYPFIKVDLASPWPRVLLAPSYKPDGGRYFGPYRNRGAARQVVELLNTHFQLRTCTRSFKTARSFGSPCLKLHIRQCVGPCVGKADREDYTQRIQEVIRFLEGDDAPLMQRMWVRMEDAARTGDFELARRLRRDVQLLQSISGVHRTIQAMEQLPTLLLAVPTPDVERLDLCLIVGGRMWSRTRARRWEPIAEIRSRLEVSFGRSRRAASHRLDAAGLDESFILERWLNRNWGHPAMLPFDGDTLPGEAILLEWIERAFATSFDGWRPVDGEPDRVIDETPSPLRRVPDPHDGWIPPQMIDADLSNIFG